MGNAYSDFEEEIFWCGAKSKASIHRDHLNFHKGRAEANAMRGYSYVYPTDPRPRPSYQQQQHKPTPQSSVPPGKTQLAFQPHPEPPAEVDTALQHQIHRPEGYHMPYSSRDPRNMLPPAFDLNTAPAEPVPPPEPPRRPVFVLPPQPAQHPYPPDYVPTVEERMIVQQRPLDLLTSISELSGKQQDRQPEAPASPAAAQPSASPPTIEAAPAAASTQTDDMPDEKPFDGRPSVVTWPAATQTGLDSAPLAGSKATAAAPPPPPPQAPPPSAEASARPRPANAPAWDRKCRLGGAQKREVAAVMVAETAPAGGGVATTQYWVKVGQGSSAVVDMTPVLRKRLDHKLSEKVATQLLEQAGGDLDGAEQRGRWAIGLRLALAKVAGATRSSPQHAAALLEECAYNAEEAVALCEARAAAS